MLETLRDLPRAQAEDVLAGALDAFLPNAYDVELSDLHRRVIQEARTVVPHGETDDRQVARRLGEELSALILPPWAEEAVKERLGHKGSLPLTQYEVGFDSQFGAEDGGFYGVTMWEAELAFRHPTRSDFLFFSPDFEPATSGFQSVAVIVARAPEAKAPHALLLVATTRGSSVTIHDAWRVFPDEVRPTDVPLELLRRFLDRYGLEFIIGLGSKPRLLHWRDEVPLAPGTEFSVKLAKTVPEPPFAAVAFTERDRKLASMKVFLAFMVDTQRYYASMARHGIHMPHPDIRKRLQR